LAFAFRCFIEGKSHWRASAVLFLLACFYPITLSKLACLPGWLVIVLLFSKFFDSRVTVILSLLVPMIFGLILFVLVNIDIITYRAMISYFGLVNLRMNRYPHRSQWTTTRIFLQTRTHSFLPDRLYQASGLLPI